MWLVASLIVGMPPADAADLFEREIQPLLRSRCFSCHAGTETQGGVDLSAYQTEELALIDSATWRKIRDCLAVGSMPPALSPALEPQDRETILDWIETSFGFPAFAAPNEPGRPVLRRLNHTEYRNAIGDLYGVDFPADELFPSENAGHGFDTSGDALSMPDAMFEKYLDAAEEIAGRAIVSEDSTAPSTRRWGVDELGGDGRPSRDGWSLNTRGSVGASFSLPRDGEYTIRAHAWAQQAGPDAAKMQLALDANEPREFEVLAATEDPGAYEVQVRASGGPHRLEASFLNDYYAPDAPDPKDRDRNLYVVSLEVTGPLDPPPISDFQRELFTRFGEDLGTGRLEAILDHLVFRAWRRPVTDRELSRLERLARKEETLEEGVRLALTAILASPHFLFRPEVERSAGAGGAVRELDSFELATRLSFFLWSSVPDEALLERARTGELTDEKVLLAELERMIADPRARALSESFAAQWLQVRSLERAQVDPGAFPQFDEALRAAMRDETLLFFETVLREERSVWELLEGDFTFVDERLAAHYGIEGVTGPAMQRVSLADSPRRGVLTHASVLTLTSTPERTSPVKRGKWIMETLLGTPPPPPPPGVEALDESGGVITSASMRERLELHRQDPACAACHVVMDPLGFGLEHFDAIGGWREEDGAFAVDAHGELPDGRSFDGAVELVELLRSEDGFLRCVVEKLLVYGLGRGLQESDRGTVDDVLAGLDPELPTLRKMIEGIVLSSAFRYRNQESE